MENFAKGKSSRVRVTPGRPWREKYFLVGRHRWTFLLNSVKCSTEMYQEDWMIVDFVEVYVLDENFYKRKVLEV